MTDERRAIELSVEVRGTPEEVWRAVATGPGISSWFVPSEVEEREGGATLSHFGPTPETDARGTVRVWDPPHRVVFDAEAHGDDPGMAFEWVVEPHGEGTCLVRLVNTGFGTDEGWDEQYDAMTKGWRLFLGNLALYRDHFPGQQGHAVVPSVSVPGERDAVWARLAAALGLPAALEVGQRVATTGSGAPPLSGTVREVVPEMATLLLDAPAPGTGFVAVEGAGDQVGVSVWLYMYGPEGEAAAGEARAGWQAWLAAFAADGAG